MWVLRDAQVFRTCHFLNNLIYLFVLGNVLYLRWFIPVVFEVQIRISIDKKLTNMSISIFRKPTYTDTLIPYTSNHPLQQKYAAIRFLYDRLNSYHLQGKEYRHEENIIHNILHNNFYPVLPQKPNHNHDSQSQNSQNKQKWCTFTYIGKETTYITKIFKHSNIKIAYRKNYT